MDTFTVVKDVTTRKIKKFNNLQARTLEFKINPIPEDVEAVGWVRKALDNALLYVTENLKPTDKIGISICSKGFARGDAGIHFVEAAKINTNEVWNLLSSIFQSNSLGLSSDTFCLRVTSYENPVGQGKKHNMYSDYHEECTRRKGIVAIMNRDNLCLPRALVVAIAHVNKDLEYKTVRQDIRKEQTTRAHALMKDADVSVPTDGCGISELQSFQDYLKEFKITVYQYGNKGRDILFQGPKTDKNINLLYHQGHYNVITSLTAAFCCKFYCEDCHIPYDHKDKHRCRGTCHACQQSPVCQRSVKIKCSDCLRTFVSQHCFENHTNSGACLKIRLCALCLKTVKTDRQHTCGEIFCKICHKHQPQDHQCYIQPDTRKPPEKGFLFVFYDLETVQETLIQDDSLLHEPNLCVFQTRCEKCINGCDDLCEISCIRLRLSNDPLDNLFNRRPVEWFLTKLLAMRPRYKQIVVIAHNGQAFDHQFLLNHMLTQTDLIPELIMRGSKIIEMNVGGNIKFIDSLNYFPMALGKLPKAFDLGDTFKKGYFPHLFNTTANQNYIGPLPAIEYYDPNAMMGNDADDDDERKQFLKWHNQHCEDIFDLQKEMVSYCSSDVQILTEACLTFRKLLLEQSNVDPFLEGCTIASVCNKVFRRNYLTPETIGIIPKLGYRYKDNQSKIAIQWLVWEQKQRKIEIMHSAKGSERVVAGVKVDGYCEETKQIFEFHGCYYHGCMKCFIHNRDKPLADDPEDTMNSRYEKTCEKIQRLRDMGYDVTEIWECKFRKSFSPEMQKYCENHSLVTSSPLNPREAFYGGRTGNCNTYYACKPGEKIKYVDICSLYPWVCKYGKFPIEHPTIYVGESANFDLQSTDGIVKCTILPPQNLYHPVLPTKMNNKLMFVLCRTCGETFNPDECNHTEEERALTGTWVVDEIVKAVEKGYQLLKIYEVWAYKTLQYDSNTKTGGLFTSMMNAFIKTKQQASGWPKGCTSDEEKNCYIEEFLNTEGIKMDIDKIVSNPGLRSLGKLILNSFWGKFGQRENQPKTIIINKSEDFAAVNANPSININSILIINENTIVVNFEFREEVADSLSTVNVAIAAYTTTLARLKLYSYLETLGERVLYYDTDSVIYISRETEEDIVTGNMIGDMTDELADYGEGSYITQFVSGGPKNYAYEVYSTNKKCLKTIVKVKGIKINYKISQKINFESIVRAVLDQTDPIEIVGRNFRRDSSHRVITKTESKIYRPNSTKRKFDDHGFSVPHGFKKR